MQRSQKNMGFFGVFIALILTFSILGMSILPVRAQSYSNYVFSIIQITDTQYLSASYPILFNSLTTWIASNSQGLNLQLVIHTGDIVDDCGKQNQWTNANVAMSILANAGIPYCWDAGNHDQTGISPNNSWEGLKYSSFNATVKKANDFWVDDFYDSKNSAARFEYNTFPFLVINIEYHANDSVIAWMKDLLDKSIASNVIVATHSYLNSTCGYGSKGDYSWETNLRSLLDMYPNVFLTLSGHDDVSPIGANNQRVGNREEIYFNRQGIDLQKGADTARIYTFDLLNLKVAVKTYVEYTQSFLTDPKNQFSFDIALQSGNTNIFPYSYFWIHPFFKNHVCFSENKIADSIARSSSIWIFKNLSLTDGKKSDFSITASGTSVTVMYYHPDYWINYTVAGSGSQTLSADKPPINLYIDNQTNSSSWNYSNGFITITGALSSVAIKFSDTAPLPLHHPTLTPLPNSPSKASSEPNATCLPFSPNVNSSQNSVSFPISSPSSTTDLPNNSSALPQVPNVLNFDISDIRTILFLSSSLVLGIILSLKLLGKRSNKTNAKK